MVIKVYSLIFHIFEKIKNLKKLKKFLEIENTLLIFINQKNLH